MSGIRTIVVPLDGSITSERALGPARDLAQRTRATVRLLTVLPMRLWSARVDDATRYLEKRAADEGLERFEISVVTDQPTVDVIVAAASDVESLVCMRSHGHGGLMEVLLGSTAASVVRRSDRPILVVGPRCAAGLLSPEPGRMVIAVDGSSTSAPLVASALDAARALSLRPDIVQVVDPGRSTPGAECEDLVAARSPISGDAEWTLLTGAPPAEVVIKHVHELPTMVVAVGMGARGRPLTAGNVAGRILHDSPCPVLMISDETEPQANEVPDVK
jgi:nucleotide-binding universal stress UspA family protein